MNEMKNKNINVRLPEEVYNDVSEVADKFNKSLSEVVRLAITNQFNKLEKGNSLDKAQYTTLIDTLKELSRVISKQETQLIGLARNINQLTKYTHTVGDDRYITSNHQLLEKYLNTLVGIQNELKEISRQGWDNI